MSLISYRALHMARVLTSTFYPLTSLAREGLRNYRSISCRRKLCFSHLIRRTMAYSTYDSGAPNSLEYRMYFRDQSDQAISPFHDIPLFADKDISTKEALNPIKQDCKKGKLRFVHNCFPYHGYIWNYGALPQTWEDPKHKDPNTECMGDNDPIDACEIGTMIAKQGDVKQVKVLGTVALIDEGETDWKILCIDVNDPLAKEMNDVDDIEKHMPGLLKATVDWFKIYKIPAGSGENQFAFNEEAKNKEFAMKIIGETHECWRKLVLKEVENDIGLACKNVTVDGSPYKMSAEEATGILNHAAKVADPKPIDPAQQ
ncbi:hypothetical protein pdam_00009483, partial [Pocillopora damicornis]